MSNQARRHATINARVFSCVRRRPAYTVVTAVPIYVRQRTAKLLLLLLLLLLMMMMKVMVIIVIITIMTNNKEL